MAGDYNELWCRKATPATNVFSQTGPHIDELLRTVYEWHGRRKKNLRSGQEVTPDVSKEDVAASLLVRADFCFLQSCSLKIASASSQRQGDKPTNKVAVRLTVDLRSKKPHLPALLADDVEYCEVLDFYKHSCGGRDFILADVCQYTTIEKKGSTALDAIVSLRTGPRKIIDAADIDRPVCIWPKKKGALSAYVLDYESIRGTAWGA